MELTRLATRELARAQRDLTISGLLPASTTSTGFVDIKMVRTTNKKKSFNSWTQVKSLYSGIPIFTCMYIWITASLNT
jgi:hypothetical protein